MGASWRDARRVGLRAGCAGARVNKAARAPPLRPRGGGWKESGSRSAAPSRRFPQPLDPSAPPHYAWAPNAPSPYAADAAAPSRRGARVSGWGRAGRGTRGAVDAPPPRESGRVGATPRPQPSLGTSFLSAEAAVISKPLGF